MDFSKAFSELQKHLRLGRDLPKLRRKHKRRLGKITCKVCKWRKTHSQHDICPHCLKGVSGSTELRQLVRDLDIK